MTQKDTRATFRGFGPLVAINCRLTGSVLSISLRTESTFQAEELAKQMVQEIPGLAINHQTGHSFPSLGVIASSPFGLDITGLGMQTRTLRFKIDYPSGALRGNEKNAFRKNTIVHVGAWLRDNLDISPVQLEKINQVFGLESAAVRA